MANKTAKMIPSSGTSIALGPDDVAIVLRSTNDGDGADYEIWLPDCHEDAPALATELLGVAVAQYLSDADRVAVDTDAFVAEVDT